MHNKVRIGRAGDNDVVINQPVVSGHHAEVTMTGPGVFSIEDLGSTNGTFVNGNRIRSAQISLQDKVLLGNIEISVAKLFGLQPPAPVNQGGNQQVAGAKNPLDFRAEFGQLRFVFQRYIDYRQQINKKYNMKMVMIRIVISVALGLLSFLVISMADESNSMLRYIISPVVMGLTMGVSMMAGNNPKKEQELKALKIELFKNYVCPNPKCRMQLGEKEWELWALGHTCPKCNAIWSD